MTVRARLLPALLEREIDVMLGAFALACMAGALLIAREITASGSSAAPAGLFIVVRRLDITLLFVMALITMLRIAARTEADHAAGWAAAPCTARGGRAAYGPAIALSAFAAAAIVFAGGAVAFAAGVRLFGDTAELVHALARTLSAGLLVLACFSIYTAVLGVLLKRTYATMFFAVALIIIPYVLTLPYLRDGTVPPRWLYIWLTSYPPPLTLPADIWTYSHAVGYIAGGVIILAAVSHRYAVRQP